MNIPPEDIRALRRDKYGNDPEADLSADIARLEDGEPLAYVVGWVPFLGLRIYLDTLPLIPRLETEWWTEKLIAHLGEKFGSQPFTCLDLCAGSGAIGLAVMKHLPEAQVAFAEIVPAHASLIRRNLRENGLAETRATFYVGDLFSEMPPETRFDVIASNPPYVPEYRKLPKSVAEYEPHGALYAGPAGLAFLGRIAREVPAHLKPGGEAWVECDAEHAEEARGLFEAAGSRETTLHTDQYGRGRLVVSYW